MSVDDLTIELTKIYYSLYRKREGETQEGTRNLAFLAISKQQVL